MAINKVIYGGNTLIDLTGDSVTSDKLLIGVTAHDMSGTQIEGKCSFDSDTSGATATASEVLFGSTAYARGTKITGMMPNNAGNGGIINEKAQEFTIPQGYSDGSGKVKIDSTEQSKIIPGNIKQGVTILGILGELEPSSAVKAQSKTVTPSKSIQTVLPDDGIDYLSQVVVNAIPYKETANSAGGTTVTIAG